MQQVQLSEMPSSKVAQDTECQRMQETRLSRNELETLVNDGIISRHPHVVSGAFVFTGTRVPVYNLWDYLSAGDSLDEFLDSFPTVSRSLAEKAIARVGNRLTEGASRFVRFSLILTLNRRC